MKCKRGLVLQIDDKVVATASNGYQELVIGKVVSFTPKRVYIKVGDCSPELRAPNQVAKIS